MVSTKSKQYPSYVFEVIKLNPFERRSSFVTSTSLFYRTYYESTIGSIVLNIKTDWMMI